MKLKGYLKKNDINYEDFAQQLGITRVTLSCIFTGRSRLLPRYWEKIVELTHGEVTIEDLVEECLEYEYKQNRKRKKQNGKK